MKLASIALPGLLVLAGCTTEPEAPVLTARKSIRPVRQTLITGKHWQS